MQWSCVMPWAKDTCGLIGFASCRTISGPEESWVKSRRWTRYMLEPIWQSLSLLLTRCIHARRVLYSNGRHSRRYAAFITGARTITRRLMKALPTSSPQEESKKSWVHGTTRFPGQDGHQRLDISRADPVQKGCCLHSTRILLGLLLLHVGRGTTCTWRRFSFCPIAHRYGKAILHKMVAGLRLIHWSYLPLQWPVLHLSAGCHARDFGNFNALEKSFPGGFIYGLPRLFLDHALLWQPFGTAYRRIDRVDDNAVLSSLPSWSWSG